MSRLTRDGTAEPVSKDQILRHERGQGNIHFSCSADHVQDWQPYPVDPYSCYMCDHTWVSGECEIIGRTHSFSHCTALLMCTQLIISSRSVRGSGGRVEAGDKLTSEVLVDLEEGTQYICKFFEGLSDTDA